MKVLFLKMLAKSIGAEYTQQNMVNYNTDRKISVTLRDRKSCKDTAHTWAQPCLKIRLSPRSRNADATASHLHSQRVQGFQSWSKCRSCF